MLTKLTTLFFLLACTMLSHAQPGVAINTNGAAPATASILDVSSTAKGILLPRMSSGQRKAIANPQPGLLVFDLDKSSFYMHDGEQWRPLGFTTENLLPLIERTPNSADKSVKSGCDVGMFGVYAVAGAREEANELLHNQGAVYIYYKENNTWKLQQKLQPADGGNADNFGASVAIYNDIIAVGSTSSKVNGITAGAVYIYKRSGSTWNLVKKLLPPLPEANASFGHDVSVYNGKVLVSCPYKTINGLDNAGVVYLYDNINNDWVLSKEFTPAVPRLYGNYGESVKIYNNDVVIGYPGNILNNIKSGSVQVVTRNPINNTWQEATIDPGIFYQRADMRFGSSVDLYKDSIIIGAPNYTYIHNNISTANAGIVFNFHRSASGWGLPTVNEGTQTSHYKGAAVAMGYKYFMAGSPGDESGGSAFGSNFNFRRYYHEIDRDAGAAFGSAIAISGNDFIIGSPDKNGGIGSVQFGTFE